MMSGVRVEGKEARFCFFSQRNKMNELWNIWSWCINRKTRMDGGLLE
jgi:hypothetical protein